MQKIFRVALSVLWAFVFVTSALAQAGEKNKLKVMTYNIWNGFDWGKDIERKANLVEWIKKQKPDVLALQELCGYDEQQLKEDAMKWGHQYVQILKSDGYATALTSNRPIVLKERGVKPFWHGLLHCETYGIDFFVVHLSPADCDFRLKEAKLITDRIEGLKNDSFVILGDFNSHSPFDAIWLENNLEYKKKLQGDGMKENRNLRHGKFDYAVISQFLACPAIDVCLNRIDAQNSFSFPTQVLIGKYGFTKENVGQERERIDYILVSPKVAEICSGVQIFNGEDTQLLSDHFPMMAEFDLIVEQ